MVAVVVLVSWCRCYRVAEGCEWWCCCVDNGGEWGVVSGEWKVEERTDLARARPLFLDGDVIIPSARTKTMRRTSLSPEKNHPYRSTLRPSEQLRLQGR